MLLSLRIENLALIEAAELEFAPGLNVLTGETGAGKTMLAQAIGLVTGATPGAGLVGPHGQEAYVEAELEVPEAAWSDERLATAAALRPEGEETLVVARRISAAGRSRAFLWGRGCARADLEAIGDLMVEVSSQHEARRLGRPAVQLAMLDAAAGHGDEVAAMEAAWSALRAARAELEAERERARDADRRRGELEELAARVGEAAPQPGERTRLAAERDRLRHVDELASAFAGAAALVNPEDGEGALTLAGRAAESIAAVERFDASLAPVAGDLRDAALRLQEAAIDLRARLDGLEADPGQLEAVEARLQLFSELESRFGAPVEELAGRAEEAQAALDALAGGDARLADLAAAADRAEADARAAADRLAQLRRNAAPRFARDVERELADLGMEQARLDVRLVAAELGTRGADAVSLQLAANSGLEAQPLAAVASGGELSRIALAIRVAARGGGGAGTMLLDEVDAGVGGRTAGAVGDKLARLAASAQLICITHLPQIAGRADRHLRVDKAGDDPAVTTVAVLSDAEVVDELARMLGGGDADETARRHAESLLKHA